MRLRKQPPLRTGRQSAFHGCSFRNAGEELCSVLMLRMFDRDLTDEDDKTSVARVSVKDALVLDAGNRNVGYTAPSFPASPCASNVDEEFR